MQTKTATSIVESWNQSGGGAARQNTTEINAFWASILMGGFKRPKRVWEGNVKRPPARMSDEVPPKKSRLKKTQSRWGEETQKTKTLTWQNEGKRCAEDAGPGGLKLKKRKT